MPGPGLNQTAQFENCRGGNGLVELPFDQVRPHIPDDFDLSGLTSETASLLYKVLDCDRIVFNETVVEDAKYFEFSAFVFPTNESWKAPGTNRFLLDVRTSHDAWTGWLAEVGIVAETSSFEESIQPQGGSASIHLWKVSNGANSFGFSYRVTGQLGGGSNAPQHYWAGTKPFLRVDASQDYDLDLDTDVTAFESSGTSNAATIVGPSWAAPSQSYLSFEMTWTIGEGRFG